MAGLVDGEVKKDVLQRRVISKVENIAYGDI